MALTKVSNSLQTSAPVSVKDYGAVGDGVTDDLNAIQAALNTGSSVYFPEGTYLVSRAIQIRDHQDRRIFGDKATIKRTDQTIETIDGESVCAIVYVSTTRHIVIEGLYIYSDAASGCPSGLVFNDSTSNPSNLSVRDVTIYGVSTGVLALSTLYMADFTRIHLVRCIVAGFDFYTYTNTHTSLSFNNCWVENSLHPYRFDQAYYSVMNACGADYCNYDATAKGSASPYGANAVAGDASTPFAIYHFKRSSFTVNGCGTEESCGRAMIFGSNANNSIVVNNPQCQSLLSTWEPNYSAYTNWAVGPIEGDTGAANFTVTATRGLVFNNTYAQGLGKPEAEILAFNYSTANGDLEGVRGVVIATASGTDLIKGFDSYVIEKNTLAISNLKTDPTFYGRIAQKTGYGNSHNGVYQDSVKITGTGNVITIPFTSQATANRKFFIQLRGIDQVYNGTTPNAFSSEIAVTSLTNLKNLSHYNDAGIISTVTISGLDLIITLTTSVTDPMLTLFTQAEAYSLMELDNATIA